MSEETPNNQSGGKGGGDVTQKVIMGGCMAVMGLLIIILVFGAGAILGDRTGAGTGSGMINNSTNNGGGGDEDDPNTPIPPVCTNVIQAAQQYMNRGIVYSQSAPHCGKSSTTGPNGVGWLDCSGFTSRSYHDAGHLPSKNWCLNTLMIANSPNYIRVAKNKETAKNILAPGDIILINMGDPDGPARKTGNSHAVIFLSRSGNRDTIYESTPGKGPHKATYRFLDNPRYTFYGVYRSKGCLNN